MERVIPHVVSNRGDSASIVEYVSAEIDQIKALVSTHGAVLFRGFGVKSQADFQNFIDVLKSKPMNYVYRSTPRTSLGGDVLTATEYPPRLEIPLHCENSYQRSWPLWIVLCCIAPASTGGQTPVADMRRVTSRIGADIINRFAQRSVKYIRHYRPRMDLSWQDVFQTNDKSKVELFCRENALHFEWLGNDTLRTEQICQGVATHPLTGEVVFFNQAHLFHPSSLGAEMEQDLIELFGASKLPRNARYGDDGEIASEDLNAIRSAFNAEAVNLEWQAGDIVVLDNMQMAHGRRPFSGERRVLASLLNQYSPY